MAKIKVLYSKKLPIPGNRYANETFEAELELEIFQLDPATQYATAFADVRAAVEAEFSQRRTVMNGESLSLTENLENVTEIAKELKKEKNRPAWMDEGADPETSDWVSDYAGAYEDVPDELNPPSVGQIAFIENLMHDKVIPPKDERALSFFEMLETGIMDKTSAKRCIDYLKRFKWKPEHKQRGYDLEKGVKR